MLPRLLLRSLSVLSVSVGSVSWCARAAEPTPPVSEYFPLGQVKVTSGPFAHAQELNRRYVLAHDPDRLLAPFLRAAGLAAKAENYPNWESQGLAGHSAGHFLTALAQLAALGDEEASQKLDYTLSELARCQEAHGTGYVGAIGDGPNWWDDIAAGRLKVEPFSVNGAWVPWYNLHKTFAGLRDAWLIANRTAAKDMLIRLADWCEGLLSGLGDEQMQEMLRAEHGGMNEVLADVAAITGDERYLRLAERFCHRAVLDPLVRGEDRLNGLHANTQIPKVIGYGRIAELGGDGRGRGAAHFFWTTVVERRSVAFGGNSVREHFNALGDFSSMLESREGPETCNTYNMLRLTEQLFRQTPDRRYADYYERALFNHILSSQHPEHGGLVYFTPIRPRHYRVYSQPEVCFWCCVGSGMESHGKYGRFIYSHDGADLRINLFVASTLDWSERGVRVEQVTRFPDEPRSVVRFSLRTPQRFAIRVRQPGWVAEGKLGVTVNGQSIAAVVEPDGYVSIEREWRDGDQLGLDLPMRTALEPLPGDTTYAALVHGPIVLAAKTGTENVDGLIAGDTRFGHIAPGPYLPLAEAPMLVGDLPRLAEHVRRLPGETLRFSAAEIIEPAGSRDLELIPFFRVHDARYMTYWRVATPGERAQVVDELAAAERETMDLAARTVDQITPGEQQPEVEHDYAGEDSRTGTHLGRSWRETGAWFSYRLRTESNPNLRLRLTYDGGERDRGFDVLVNDQVVGTVKLAGQSPDRFVDVEFALPAATAAGQSTTITVRAHAGRRSGTIFDLRLLRPAVPADAPAL